MRTLRPIRAVACPRELGLVPAADCEGCGDRAGGSRPRGGFVVRCGHSGGGPEYAKMRSEVEEGSFWPRRRRG